MQKSIRKIAVILGMFAITATTLSGCKKDNEATGAEKNAFMKSTKFTVVELYGQGPNVGWVLLATDQFRGDQYKIRVMPVPKEWVNKYAVGSVICGCEVWKKLKYEED